MRAERTSRMVHNRRAADAEPVVTKRQGPARAWPQCDARWANASGWIVVALARRGPMTPAELVAACPGDHDATNEMAWAENVGAIRYDGARWRLNQRNIEGQRNMSLAIKQPLPLPFDEHEAALRTPDQLAAYVGHVAATRVRLNGGAQLFEVEVTAPIARELLRNHTERERGNRDARGNRPLKSHKVASLARMLRAGEMVASYDAMVFDVDGFGINGQHRCHAVIETGISHRFLIVLAAPANTWLGLDQGSGRTSAEVLARQAQDVALATLAIQMRESAQVKPTPQQLTDWLADHAEAMEVCMPLLSSSARRSALRLPFVLAYRARPSDRPEIVALARSVGEVVNMSAPQPLPAALVIARAVKTAGEGVSVFAKKGELVRGIAAAIQDHCRGNKRTLVKLGISDGLAWAMGEGK